MYSDVLREGRGKSLSQLILDFKNMMTYLDVTTLEIGELAWFSDETPEVRRRVPEYIEKLREPYKRYHYETHYDIRGIVSIYMYDWDYHNRYNYNELTVPIEDQNIARKILEGWHGQLKLKCLQKAEQEIKERTAMRVVEKVLSSTFTEADYDLSF